MHEDVRANPRIGKDKADRVVDLSYSELVGIEEEWSNREAGCVRAGALISAHGGRVNPVEIPNCDKGGGKSVLSIIALVRLIKFTVAAIGYDEVTVVVRGRALIVRQPFKAATGRKGKCGDVVGIRAVKHLAFVKGNLRSRGIRLQNPERKIDLHPVVVSPAARIREPGDDS
jgi:hypothetical protein